MIYLNGYAISPTIFPDNTSQVWKIPAHILSTAPGHDFAFIDWTFTTEGDIVQLAQLKDLLDSREIASCLRIRYLPYGRQDKAVSNDATFALHSFAKLLNQLYFCCIEIIDPHSSVATDLIKNSVAIQSTTLSKIWCGGGYDIVCYPDKGALTKYSELYDFPFIYGEKVRDQSTGNITNYKVIGDPAGKTVLIVDDICDGGMTFKILAKDLLAKGAKEVNLFVTHGIFSRGLKTLKDSGINRIFAQDGEASEVQNQIVYRTL